jgi:hypothetical protein
MSSSDEHSTIVSTLKVRNALNRTIILAEADGGSCEPHADPIVALTELNAAKIGNDTF